jgi:hypothetical protein
MGVEGPGWRRAAEEVDVDAGDAAVAELDVARALAEVGARRLAAGQLAE